MRVWNDTGIMRYIYDNALVAYVFMRVNSIV